MLAITLNAKPFTTNTEVSMVHLHTFSCWSLIASKIDCSSQVYTYLVLNSYQFPDTLQERVDAISI
jgi:hypothetical protein